MPAVTAGPAGHAERAVHFGPAGHAEPAEGAEPAGHTEPVVHAGPAVHFDPAGHAGPAVHFDPAGHAERAVHAIPAGRAEPAVHAAQAALHQHVHDLTLKRHTAVQSGPADALFAEQLPQQSDHSAADPESTLVLALEHAAEPGHRSAAAAVAAAHAGLAAEQKPVAVEHSQAERQSEVLIEVADGWYGPLLRLDGTRNALHHADA